jgi:hypothetical protein
MVITPLVGPTLNVATVASRMMLLAAQNIRRLAETRTLFVVMD